MKHVNIEIDAQPLEVAPGTTILAAARSLGIDIPVLCFSQNCESSAGCMVCAVKDNKSGRMLASCSSLCTGGMQIDTCSPEIRRFRAKALGLILSEHKGACEGPCFVVCPQGLDIPRLMCLVIEDESNVDFVYDRTICEDCGGKCEKVCNRKKADSPVMIRQLLFRYGTDRKSGPQAPAQKRYNHLFGALSETDLAELQKNSIDREKLSDGQNEALRCLQCACSAKDDCRLRDLADEYEARQSAYQSANKADYLKFAAGKIIFQPSKCVRCGRCVSLGQKINPGRGPVMAYRSGDTMVCPPVGMNYEQAFAGHEEEYVNECPTGAIDWSSVYDK